MQTLYAGVPFSPESKAELRQLMRFLDTDAEYAKYRRKTLRSPEYKTAIKQLRQFHRDLYKGLVDYKRIKGECPWRSSGLTARCEAVARKFCVPHWDVVGVANSAVPFR